ncbi:MAG: glutathione S-transferase N-terminal domain-containing protein [Pseudomonadota bacterium]
MIELYSASTPNGHKVSIALEEMALPYRVHVIDFEEKDQLKPKFLKISPNGRIPAIVDGDTGTALMESGAILIYLAEKSGQFLPIKGEPRAKVLEWLMFQMANVGPMMGQTGVFRRYFHVHLPEAIQRYANETQRLYQVMDKRLAEVEYLAGDYSIADMATAPWLCFADWIEEPYTEYPHISRWMNAVTSRPAFAKGMEIPASVDAGERLRRAKSITTD